MLQRFSVDIWLLFGSFAYGVEGRLLLCGEDWVRIEPLVADESERDPLFGFFDELSLNPRGLVRAEIRLFEDRVSETDTTPLSSPIALLTEVAPQILPDGEGRFLLHFSHIKGVTHRDGDSWQKLRSQLPRSSR